jgi:tetratricopeptide (TPR) repeat protein
MSRTRVLWMAVAVALVAALPFLPVLQNGFVTWDDDTNFIANTAYRGLGVEQLRWMWTTFHHGHYVPLSWMTLGLDYTLWGMDPRGYHLTSLVIHAANAAVLFLVARRLLSAAMGDAASDATAAMGAVFAALLFAVHPLRVESVAWATERRDVLSGLFYSLSLLLYLQFAETSGRQRYWAAVSVFAMALLAKATAMTLPAVLLIVNVYPLRRMSLREFSAPAAQRVYREIAPFIALSVGAMILSIVALSPGEQLSLPDKLVVSAWGLAFYIWKTLAPVGMAPFYPLPREIVATSVPFLLAYLTVAGLAVVAWQTRRRAPGVTAALVAFVAIVLPMLGVVQNGPQIAADRYTYHAAPALALLFGALFTFAWTRRRAVTAVVGIGILTALATLTWRQAGYWRDSQTMWSRVLEVSDDAAIGHNAMANLLMEQERITPALEHYQRAVQLDPSLAAAHDNLGVALARLGRASEAYDHFERATASKDEADEAFNNWGAVLLSQGDLAGAIDRFRKAAAANPSNVAVQSNWGSALARAGALDSAIAHFKRAADLDPRHARTRANWGVVLARQAKWAEASEQLIIAAELDPDDADTRANLERVRQELAKAPKRP